MDQVALGQFLGEPAGNALQLALCPVARVDDQSALRAAEGHFDKRAFIAHQRGKRLDLRLVDIWGIADTALHRFEMFRMNRPVAGKGVEPVAKSHAKPDHIGRVRHHDLFGKILAKLVIRLSGIERRDRVAKIGLNRLQKFITGHLSSA